MNVTDDRQTDRRTDGDDIERTLIKWCGSMYALVNDGESLLLLIFVLMISSNTVTNICTEMRRKQLKLIFRPIQVLPKSIHLQTQQQNISYRTSSIIRTLHTGIERFVELQRGLRQERRL